MCRRREAISAREVRGLRVDYYDIGDKAANEREKQMDLAGRQLVKDRRAR
jgi:hypothetical protein